MINNNANKILNDWILIAKDKGNTEAVKDLLLLQDIVINKLEYITNKETITRSSEILSNMSLKAKGETVQKIKVINEAIRQVITLDHKRQVW